MAPRGEDAASAFPRRDYFAERLVDQPLHFRLDPPALRRRLHHHDREYVILRIDKEERADNAVPAVFSQRQRRTGSREVPTAKPRQKPLSPPANS